MSNGALRQSDWVFALGARRGGGIVPGNALDRLQCVAPRRTSVCADYDDLLELVGDSRFVLLDEATHGTGEFYQERARITQRLILEKGFTVVAIEGEWHDAHDVNRFIHGVADLAPGRALETFSEFPHWMWRNREIEALVGWLREHNAGRRVLASRSGSTAWTCRRPETRCSRC